MLAGTCTPGLSLVRASPMRPRIACPPITAGASVVSTIGLRDLLILTIVALGPVHGYAIAQRLTPAGHFEGRTLHYWSQA
jgi:hypothetical protein